MSCFWGYRILGDCRDCVLLGIVSLRTKGTVSCFRGDRIRGDYGDRTLLPWGTVGDVACLLGNSIVVPWDS